MTGCPGRFDQLIDVLPDQHVIRFYIDSSLIGDMFSQFGAVILSGRSPQGPHELLVRPDLDVTEAAEQLRQLLSRL